MDTNILLRWVRRDAAEYDIIRLAMTRLADEGAIPAYTSQNLGEFWNVLTRPVDRNGYGLTTQESDERALEIEESLQLLPDLPAVHQEWRRLLVDYSVCGVQVHDARLVAAMRVHGVGRILTFNTKDFGRYKFIEAVHPSHFQ
ncbi:MAG TPA: PIN domain-containing protein [Terracidiphilus sp.]|nr:PIN domain-containing protein [Terracidiphilus sp.]